jgi:hypothetical protein
MSFPNIWNLPHFQRIYNLGHYSMKTCRHQNAGENIDMKIANTSFKIVDNFKYSGASVTIKITFPQKLRA